MHTCERVKLFMVVNASCLHAYDMDGMKFFKKRKQKEKDILKTTNGKDIPFQKSVIPR